ncbi:hypothetical protein EDB87DRAFT_634510 [Lactarius vividus]|nr:hypothetical protein EDB87DRAFT_634510 [Lactarius vividus]
MHKYSVYIYPSSTHYYSCHIYPQLFQPWRSGSHTSILSILRFRVPCCLQVPQVPITNWLIRIAVNMPQSSPAATPSSNFHSTFVAALNAYQKKTKNDLLEHPLAAQLQSCNSSADILALLRDKVEEYDQSKSRNERLSSWLNPTINVLYAFSATLGEGCWADILTCQSNLRRCWGLTLGRQGR